jgi:plastocyanin
MGTRFAPGGGVTPATRSPIALLLGLLWVAASCTVGDLSGPSGGGNEGGADAGSGGGDDLEPGGPDAAPPTYAVTMSPDSVDLTLGTVAELSVTLSSDRFAGAVSLSAQGVPESWLVSFEPAPVVALGADEIRVVTVRVEVPTDATVTVQADAAAGQHLVSAAVDVANELVIPIGEGTAAGDHPFPGTSQIRLGASVRFVNLDQTRHRIHSDSGNAGFPHEPSPGMDPALEGEQGGSYAVTIDRTGGFNYYCHEHQVGSGVGRIEVVDAPE